MNKITDPVKREAISMTLLFGPTLVILTINVTVFMVWRHNNLAEFLCFGFLPAVGLIGGVLGGVSARRMLDHGQFW